MVLLFIPMDCISSVFTLITFKNFSERSWENRIWIRLQSGGNDCLPAIQESSWATAAGPLVTSHLQWTQDLNIPGMTCTKILTGAYMFFWSSFKFFQDYKRSF